MERRIKSSKTDHSSILLQMNESDLTRKSGSNAHASNGIKLRCRDRCKVHKKLLAFLTCSSVQFSRVWLFVTPWIAARQASLSIANSRSSLKLMSIELVMPSQPSHPLSSPSPPAPNPSQHEGLSFPMSQLFAWGGQSTAVSDFTSCKFAVKHVVVSLSLLGDDLPGS